MSRQKRYSILTLAVVVVAALIAAFTLLFGVTVADASDSKYITLTSKNYFYTANNAEIGEYATTEEDSEVYYTTFLFTEEDSAITYRKNLAYHWYEADEDSTKGYTDGYLSTTIGFTTIEEGNYEDMLPFETFTIKFQSQQYSQTKDGVTSNYIKFVANSAGTGVYVLIGDEDAVDVDTYEDIEDYDELVYLTDVSSITISFTGYASGVYTVEVTDGTDTVEGKFENVHGSYSQYVSSSSSTSVIPLTYSATFASYNDPDSTEDSSAVGMILYDFNNQSFELSGSGGHVTDDVAPVLCLNEVVTSLSYGATIDLDYAVIDMLTLSPSSTLYYYILTEEQQEDDSFNYNDYENEDLFIEASSSDDAIVICESGAYTGSYEAKGGQEQSDAVAYVKVYYYTSDSYSEDWVCLDWYVSEDNLAYINSAQFIKAVYDNEGATYTYTCSDAPTSHTYEEIISEIAEEYQKKVEAALSDQEATAGSGNYFYLPSFEEFVSDNYTDYTSLSFSIYYVNSSSNSSTSLAYNELAIEIDEDGYYRFAIYVTDAEGNSMYYQDGNTLCEIDEDDIADLVANPSESDLKDLVPLFGFTVYYEGLEVDDPGAQDIGFVDTEYDASGFSDYITGLSDKYKATYTLFVFDLAAYTEENGEISYAEFISRVEELFESNREYFKTIKVLADMDETDADYDTYADYEWDDDELTFVPQDENTFYVILLTVSDQVYATEDVQAFMCISVSAAAASLKGESQWLKNNIASVVLLCVAGAALIGIVLLIVIKPREKGDIDLIDENDEKKSKKRKFGKKAK